MTASAAATAAGYIRCPAGHDAVTLHAGRDALGPFLRARCLNPSCRHVQTIRQEGRDDEGESLKAAVIGALENRGGRTNEEIAVDVGCSPAYVATLARAAGEPPRRPGRRPGRRNAPR